MTHPFPSRRAADRFNGIRGALDEGLAQVRGLPLLAVSAKTGKGLDTMLSAAFELRDVWSKRVSTSALNRWFEDALTANPPPAPGRSEEHTSELQSLMRISYAVFCLKKKTSK